MTGLQVLIIHLGTNPKQVTAGASDQHDLTFITSALRLSDDGTLPDDCTAIVSLDDFDFVFQHSGNSETDRAWECWKQRSENERVVFFTGGSGLPSKHQGSGIPCVPHMDSADNLLELQWDNVPSDFDGTADELVGLLDPQPVEVLSALSILCQGYLAAHAEEYVRAEGHDEQKEGYWKPREISDALKQMEWTEDHLAHTADGQPEKATQLDWWRSSFEDTDDLVGEAEDEWNDAGSWPNSAVKDLLGRITDGEEPLQGEEDRRIIADAYRELEKKLRGTS